MTTTLKSVALALTLLAPLAVPTVVVASEADETLIVVKSDRQAGQGFLSALFGTNKP
jgi:hypothetical protein